ncbi:hypothetical protein Fcan01_11253 [Folsomia candida]|uniref:Uncharacterized protein n=1 Tax=Folsomia candida TaxID=158441 RepID=A0A226E8Q9_FOLCA|nr:hypothetical protein Fcan01_11253 [Folsomia candida]
MHLNYPKNVGFDVELVRTTIQTPHWSTMFYKPVKCIILEILLIKYSFAFDLFQFHAKFSPQCISIFSDFISDLDLFEEFEFWEETNTGNALIIQTDTEQNPLNLTVLLGLKHVQSELCVLLYNPVYDVPYQLLRLYNNGFYQKILSIPTSAKFQVLVAPDSDILSDWYAYLGRARTDFDSIFPKTFLLPVKRHVDTVDNHVAYLCILCRIPFSKLGNLRTVVVLKFFQDLIQAEQRHAYTAVKSPELDKLKKPEDKYIHPTTIQTAISFITQLLQESKHSVGLHQLPAVLALANFSFPQWVSYLLIEGVIQTTNVSSPQVSYPVHPLTLPQLESQDLVNPPSDASLIIIRKNEHNFLTCHGTRSMIKYALYLTPFDAWIWTISLVTLITSSLVIYLLQCDDQNDTVTSLVIQLLAIFLEQSSEPGTFLRTGISKKIIFMLWCIVCIVLGTGHRAIFTTDMITPPEITLPYAQFRDLYEHNFTFAGAVSPDGEAHWIKHGEILDFVQSDVIVEFEFLKKSGIQELVNLSRRILSKSGRNNRYTYFRAVSFTDPVHFKNLLARCDGRIAYIDLRERIDRILPYLNEAMSKVGSEVKFGKGGAALWTSYTGWTWLRGAREGQSRLAEGLRDRLQILISAGIYSFWENLFDRFKGRELFDRFDDVVQKKSSREVGLTMGANVQSAFILWAVCSGFSGLVWIWEIVGFLFNRKAKQIG